MYRYISRWILSINDIYGNCYKCHCDSCYSEGYYILFNNYCYDICPENYYLDENNNCVNDCPGYLYANNITRICENCKNVSSPVEKYKFFGQIFHV